VKGSVWWDEEVPEDLGVGYTRAVLEAIRAGAFVLEWKRIVSGDLEVDVMTRPLAIGDFDDHVCLYGCSAELVDLIAQELGDVMSPTPYLYDLASQHPDARWVGPHTLPTLLGVENGAVGMTKTAAKAHADAIKAECEASGYPDGSMLVGWGKTYGLQRYSGSPDGVRAQYALEYGWPLREAVSWGSRNASNTGWVVQPPAWAHFYRTFRDYSMAAWYVHILGRLEGRTTDLREVAQDPARAGVVSLTGPVPFIIHPDCPQPLQGPPEADTEPPPPTERSPQDLPTLILGDKGQWVGVWQGVLIASGFSLHPYGADEHFGKLTAEMTRRYQRAFGLEPDGVVGPSTWATVGEQEHLPITEPFTDSPFPPIQNRGVVFGEIQHQPAPTTANPEGICILGSWVQDNIVRVELPELVGILGAPSDGGVYFHKLGAEQLQGLFAAWREEELLDRIEAWAGSWVPRYIRGSRSVLSNHAYGTAFDLNAPWNPMGAEPAHVGERGCLRELVPIAHDFGFFWGGNFRGRPDGMHFELAKVL
jgi:hypothetical protein